MVRVKSRFVVYLVIVVRVFGSQPALRVAKESWPSIPWTVRALRGLLPGMLPPAYSWPALVGETRDGELLMWLKPVRLGQTMSGGEAGTTALTRRAYTPMCCFAGSRLQAKPSSSLRGLCYGYEVELHNLTLSN